MTDKNDAADPEDPRPEGHYPRFYSNTWQYVPDVLARTISLGPGGDGEEGQDWVFSYTPERRARKTAKRSLSGSHREHFRSSTLRRKVSLERRDKPDTGRSVTFVGRASPWSGQSRTSGRSRVISGVMWTPTAARSGSKTTNNARRRHRIRHTE